MAAGGNFGGRLLRGHRVDLCSEKAEFKTRCIDTKTLQASLAPSPFPYFGILGRRERGLTDHISHVHVKSHSFSSQHTI
jgi:hypothetical protein